MSLTLHPQLQADCYLLGRIDNSLLLLHKNALLPWFILVPETHENELYKLPNEQQTLVSNAVNQLAGFIETHFKTDKLNIATIGNIVPQLHIHIIGRFTDDFCWPNPVWGQTKTSPYSEEDIHDLQKTLIDKNIIQTHID